MIDYNNTIIQNDLAELYKQAIDWEKLRGKCVLITGATGMLAAYFTFMLIYLNQNYSYNISIILLLRNKGKARKLFGDNTDKIKYLYQDVCDNIDIPDNIDYIIHAAGAASPFFILNDPVGIIKANTIGTINVLNLAKERHAEKVLFTSTREIYGRIDNSTEIKESDMGILDPLHSRSCYPESKRMAETILKSFFIQYGIAFNTCRIAHSYGPVMQINNDGRVMADFMNDAVNNKDIILNSTGEDERAFCYVSDAVSALFHVLFNGVVGEAYNIANETEPVKIIDLAKMIVKMRSNSIGVSSIPLDTKAMYCNYKRVRLSTEKIESLGWKPNISLSEGLKKTLSFFATNL